MEMRCSVSCEWLRSIPACCASDCNGLPVKMMEWGKAKTAARTGFTGFITFLVLQICKDIHTPCILNMSLNLMVRGGGNVWYICAQILQTSRVRGAVTWCWRLMVSVVYYGEVTSCCLNLNSEAGLKWTLFFKRNALIMRVETCITLKIKFV